MAKIYTKTGDNGTTSLLSGHRVSKTNEVFEILGDLDELNCMIGLVIHDDRLRGVLLEWKPFFRGIQRTIMDISARVADIKQKMVSFDSNLAIILEEEIDRMSDSLPPLRNFILPGTSKGNARIHLCRCITRRVERHAWKIPDRLENNVLVYLNRLSDYFFTAARFYSHLLEEKEEKYIPM